MQNPERARKITSLTIIGLAALSILVLATGIPPAQASRGRSPGEQISTAMYFGEGKYTIDALWQGNQSTDVCRDKNYGGDVALTLFDDGSFALIFKADKHYEAWATLGSAVSCIGPVRPSSIVDHYFIGSYTSNPLQLNFQRAFSVDQAASERELRFSSGQVSFNEASAVGEVKYWMYINHQSDAEGKAFFTLRFDLSRAGGAILTTPTVTEAVGDCTALISNIDNLTPGEVLSPVIEFVDESGKPTGIIGHALFINGMQTWSVIWDGKETRLEVQYTCLNHRGYSKQAVIPAYQGTASGDPGGAGGAPPQPPQAPPAGGDSGAPLQPGDGSIIQPGQAPPAPVAKPPAALPGIPGGLPTAIGILGMAVGLGGAAISGGAVVVSVLNTALAKPPAAPRATAPRQPAPRVEKATPKQQATQKGKEQPGEKEKKEPKEKKPERKGLLQSEKEALKQYQDALDNLSGNVEKAIELLEKIRELSPEGREKLQKKLSAFKDSLDKVSKRAGNYADKIEMVQDMEQKLKSLGEKYKQIQKAHQEAFKDLQDVPEGAANQLADLTTAIETFGDVTDAALSRIPYFKHIYSDKTFEVTKSFREFTTGLRKTLAKTVFRTSIEAKKEFPAEELKQFSDGRTNRRLDPEMQEWYRQQARQQPQTQPNSVLQQVKDFIFGKEIPPDVKSMR